jgi:hypothetical protein
MSLSYIIGNITGSLFSGSFLNEIDTRLFYVSQSSDIWFGISPNDVIEFSVFDSDNNLVAWDVLQQEKNYRTASLTYLNDQNDVISYSYLELIESFNLYKNSKILVNPIDDLSSVGIVDGTYKVSYIFERLMAGNHDSNKLIIKDISPSRKEIKIISPDENSLRFQAFCFKKFEIRDVASLIINTLSQCPYDQIYNNIKDDNVDSINFLKTIFFLPTDGDFLLFLKKMYEDFINHTDTLEIENVEESLSTLNNFREQGIKTYFNNFILQNYNSISDFNDLKNKFIEYVDQKIENRFALFKNQTSSEYLQSKQFLHDFFVIHFYQNFIDILQNIFENKYFSYLKNVLNFGNGIYFTILSQDKLIEDGQLTLLIKLESGLPLSFSSKDECWISNFSIIPSLFTAILRNDVKYQTLKISPPDFNKIPPSITQQNSIKLYSFEDLTNEQSTDDQIKINKNTSYLNIDYSDFSNFVVFSSIQNRINIFKNKSIQWYSISSSVVLLDQNYSSSLSSSTVYQYYLTERDSFVNNMSDIVNSFDGYESYLFNSGKYVYLPVSNSFLDTLYVDQQDEIASEYDTTNRDSLINNVPEFILNDSNNSDYLIFLSMVGHFFDNIYIYISSLPIEKQIYNNVSSSFSTNTIKEILNSFGWNINDIIKDIDIDEVYLNSLNNSVYNILSSQDRLKLIWNRILITLPGIYKTKGTEECVKYLLSCYGIPSTILSIREYGGIDYSDNVLPTYRIEEDVYFLKYSGTNDYIKGPYPSSARSIEFKFSIENTEDYLDYKINPLLTIIPYPYTDVSNFSWKIGFFKTPGVYNGKVIFQMGSGSSQSYILSDTLPIFNGNIFNILLRKNYPYSKFEYSTDENNIPIKYDLEVQRNENGRIIFQSTSSNILLQNDNEIFSQYGNFYLGNVSSTDSFYGTLDKFNIWDIPLDESDFNCHVNDLNCYGFSGSNSNQHLWIRLSWDYPQTMSYFYNNSSAVWVNNNSSYYSIPYYYSGDLSSSLDPTLYSASLQIIEDKWISNFPTGSVNIIAYNFPEVIVPNYITSFNTSSCDYISQSIFPYNFRSFNISEEIDSSKYGPNKFKNNKIRKIDEELDTRLDYKTKSTSQINSITIPDSNQLGFFADPNDSKNKDIIRYVGNNGILEMISDPRDLYNNEYENLKQKNIEYNRSGNKKTYFNEMIILYKSYFDKSIFDVIKNIVPARSNILSGVLIEPTILERPKYQHRLISSSLSETQFLNSNIENPVKVSSDILWSDFNTDWSQISFGVINGVPQIPGYPNNYDIVLDETNISTVTEDLPSNYNNIYFPDISDDYQFSVYGDLEEQKRNDTVSEKPIWGSISRMPYDVNRSGSSIYYILKLWEKYSIYKEMGPYKKKGLDVYSSSSIDLFKLVLVNENFMRQIIHFDTNESSGWYIPCYTYDGATGHYLHQVNTFKGTPDQIVNDISSSVVNPIIPTDLYLTRFPAGSYFQIVRGYPRNHYNHKRQLFSKFKFPIFIDLDTNTIYVKGRNTSDTTVNENGINDGSTPIQSLNVSQVDVLNPTNVIDDNTPRPIITNSQTSTNQQNGLKLALNQTDITSIVNSRNILQAFNSGSIPRNPRTQLQSFITRLMNSRTGSI